MGQIRIVSGENSSLPNVVGHRRVKSVELFLVTPFKVSTPSSKRPDRKRHRRALSGLDAMCIANALPLRIVPRAAGSTDAARLKPPLGAAFRPAKSVRSGISALLASAAAEGGVEHMEAVRVGAVVIEMHVRQHHDGCPFQVAVFPHVLV